MIAAPSGRQKRSELAKDTKIEWATHTFNPWEGCQKVGPGCDNCYAESRNARFAGGLAVNWGPGAPRRRTSATNWRKPLAWNAAHEAFFAEHGHRQRVFCASLADWLDKEVAIEWLVDLLDLIRTTPALDWLLLTKRIGIANARLKEAGLHCVSVGRNDLAFWIMSWFDGRPPKNIWLGVTIVNQEEANRDITKLFSVSASKRFLSIEPLLGPVVLASCWINKGCGFGNDEDPAQSNCFGCGGYGRGHNDQCAWPSQKLDWVIVGGESGRGARPMHPDWARSLRNQCKAAGVPFLFKQWGEWLPLDGMEPELRIATDKKPWRRIEGTRGVVRVGKKAAGRKLDERTWDEVPA